MAAPKLHDVDVFGNESIRMRRELYSYEDAGELVWGTTFCVRFALNDVAKRVWPIFQDFNRWQNHHGYHYSGPFGDKKRGDLAYLMVGSDRKQATIDNVQCFVIQLIIPEHVIVMQAPAWEAMLQNGEPVGSKHIGHHCFTLMEIEDRTLVTAVMQHAYHYPLSSREKWQARLANRLEQARARQAADAKDKWETHFEPKLREFVEAQS